MIFINPWIFYDPDDIPDLTPRDNDEARGCLAGICAYIVSSSIFIWLMYLLLDFKLNEILSTDVYFGLLLVNCIIIYPILTIILMKLSFKIADKFNKKRN